MERAIGAKKIFFFLVVRNMWSERYNFYFIFFILLNVRSELFNLNFLYFFH